MESCWANVRRSELGRHSMDATNKAVSKCKGASTERTEAMQCRSQHTTFKMCPGWPISDLQTQLATDLQTLDPALQLAPYDRPLRVVSITLQVHHKNEYGLSGCISRVTCNMQRHARLVCMSLQCFCAHKMQAGAPEVPRHQAGGPGLAGTQWSQSRRTGTGDGTCH